MGNNGHQPPSGKECVECGGGGYITTVAPRGKIGSRVIPCPSCTPKSSPASPEKEVFQCTCKMTKTKHGSTTERDLECPYHGDHGHASPQATSGEEWREEIESILGCRCFCYRDESCQYCDHKDKLESFISRLIKEREEKMLARCEEAVKKNGEAMGYNVESSIEAIRSIRGKE